MAQRLMDGDNALHKLLAQGLVVGGTLAHGTGQECPKIHKRGPVHRSIPARRAPCRWDRFTGPRATIHYIYTIRGEITNMLSLLYSK